jgi:YidC/Oxa1 family membrane protein insertase
MDFGIGFLTNNIMLPILDFFYGIVPSYGLAIVALTLVIRFALYPLNAGSIRNMRRMKVTQPLMQKKIKEIQDRYKDDPTRMQQEMGGVYKEFGNPLQGCLPVIVQMPVLFALFATLRGSPFSDVSYPVNLQIFPAEQMAEVQPQAFASKPSNIYINDGQHFPVSAILPGGTKLGVGEKTAIELKGVDGRSLDALAEEYGTAEDIEFKPTWQVTKGENLVSIDENGTIQALAPGDVTLNVKVPGLATNKGFLFIDALGRVGVTDPDGTIHWDILIMILGFGISLYVNQQFSGQGASDNPQQDTINKMTPVLFSGMFLFFPLPAGVLMYMLIANIFQTAQSFILSREPLPENLQKLVDEEAARTAVRDKLDFEPKKSSAKSGANESASGKTITVKATPVKSAKPTDTKSKEVKAKDTKSTGTNASGVKSSGVGIGATDNKDKDKKGDSAKK